MQKIISKSSLKKAATFSVALISSIFTVLLVASIVFQALSQYYAISVERDLTFFDLSIMSSFTGGVFGAIICRFSNLVKFYHEKISKVFDKKGDRS